MVWSRGTIDPATKRPHGIGPEETDPTSCGNANAFDCIRTTTRLCFAAPIELNEGVEIALSPSVSFHGTIAWVNGDNCGIAFEERGDGGALLTDALCGRPPRSIAHAPKASRSSPVPTAPGRTPRAFRYDSIFVPGLRVTALLRDGREKRGIVRWGQDNIAEVFLW